MTASLPSFGHVDFGPDDAKNDARLPDYFVATPEYERVRRGSAWLVVGRKGTGKTAICQMLAEEAAATPTSLAVLLSLKNQPHTELLSSTDRAYRSPNQYISVWRFLIALETCKLVIKDESVDNSTRFELTSFLTEHFGNHEVRSLDALRSARAREWKFGLKLPTDTLPGLEAARTTIDAASDKIHYGQAATALLARLSRVRTDNTFYLLFDDLDEDYSPSRRYHHLIISLLKAAYQIKLEVSEYFRLLPVVVLRDDIFDQLDDHDLNKFDEQTVRLRWSSDPSLTSPFSLRRLVNARIAATAVHGGDSDHWHSLVDETEWQGSSAWSFLVNRTLDRPRDVLKSLKACQPFESGPRLRRDAIVSSERPFSEWLYRELGNEIFRTLPHYREIFALLGSFDSSFTLAQWADQLGKLPSVMTQAGAEPLLARLYDFSVIGTSDADAATFRYQVPQAPFDPAARYTLHPGLIAHLRRTPSRAPIP